MIDRRQGLLGIAAGVAALTRLDRLVATRPPGTESATNALYVIARDAGAAGNGIADDRAALSAAANANQTIAFGPGSYRIASSWNVPARCSLVFFKGATLKVGAGATVTINGPFSAGLFRVFDITGGGRLVFAPGAVDAVHPEWWHDGGDDYHDAILAAINAVSLDNGMPLRFVGRTYRTRPIVVPAVGTAPNAQARAVCLEGVGGGGADRKPEIRFTGAGGFDFTASGAYVRLAHLQINHAAEPAQANGVGLDLGDASYHELDDVWISNFDVNIQLTGLCIYSRWAGVRSVYGNTACVRWTTGGYAKSEALVNGNWFENCQFTGSPNGSGLQVIGSGGSAAVAFRSCKFEGNAQYGFVQTSTGYLNVKFDACYWEDNGAEDCYIENGYSNASSLVSFDTCYFDPHNGRTSSGQFSRKQHRRIVVRQTRLKLENTKIFQMAGDIMPYDVPPVASTGNVGAQPNIALNNDYDLATFTDNEAAWFIVDSKHPVVASAPRNPGDSGLSLKSGSFFLNTGADAHRTLGWIVTASGHGRAAVAPRLTAHATANAHTITVDDIQHQLESGDHVQVEGVTFDRSAAGGSTADDFAMVLSTEVGGRVVLDGIPNGETSGALTYRRAQVAPVSGGIRSLDDSVVPDRSTVSFPLSGSGYGLVQLAETAGAHASALLMVANGSVFIVFQSARGRFTVTPGTGGSINLAVSAGELRVENRTGTTNHYSAVQLPTV